MFTCCLFWEFRCWHDLLSPKYTFVVTTHRNKLRKSTGLCCLPVIGSYRMIQLILFSYKACGTMGRRKKNLSCLLPSRFLPFCFLLRRCFPILLTEQRKKKRKNVRHLTAKQISVCLFVCLFVVCCCYCCCCLWPPRQTLSCSSP